MRHLSIAALALSGALMAACSADDPVADAPLPARDGTVKMTTTVSLGGAATRALDANGKKTFAEGDKIAFFYQNTDGQTVTAESDALKAADITDGKTATFTVALSKPKAGGTVKYVYPAAMAGNADVDYSKLNTQDGKLTSVASKLDLATYTGNLSNTGRLPAQPTLANQLAMLALTLYDTNVAPANKVTSNVTKLVVKVGSTTYTVNRAATEGPVYVAVRPASNATVNYTATAGGAEYTKALTGENYAAGTLYNLNLKMTPSATDLSMVDCAGNARATMTTANCYMVHKAGQYKLPLVYGNAIKNGSVNSAAYTGVSGMNATFPNHAGTAIKAPWITKSTSGSGVNKGMGISVNSAQVLWQDATGLITNVAISGDYLTLTVGKDATTQEGNALIAVKIGSTIVWSWHIWVTKQKFDNLTTVATGSHNYKVTPVNLGWVGATVSQGTNTFYQWGRKDPFPGTGSVPFVANDNVTIADNIKNPTTPYQVGKKPCKETFNYMWDAKQTGTNNNIATPTVKTVYDPCPPGFCVPTSNLWYYIGGNSTKYRHMETWSATNKGATWNTNITGNELFFPASGYRYDKDSSPSSVGSAIYHWSASACVIDIQDASHDPSQSACGLNANQLIWGWVTPRRFLAQPVRAVAEE